MSSCRAKIAGDVFTHNLVIFVSLIWHFCSTSNTCKIENVQSTARTIKFGINSFTYEGAKLWNALRQDFKVLPSIEDFEDAMASF